MKRPRATWLGAAVGFIGVVLVLQPHHQPFNIGALIALAGAFCLSLACISVRRLGATEPTSRILFYYFVISTRLCAPFAFVDWRPFGLRGSVYMVGIASCYWSARRSSSSPIATRRGQARAVLYTVIVFTALIDWFLWNRAPTLLVVFGIAMVIGGGIIAIRKRQNPAPDRGR